MSFSRFLSFVHDGVNRSSRKSSHELFTGIDKGYLDIQVNEAEHPLVIALRPLDKHDIFLQDTQVRLPHTVCTDQHLSQDPRAVLVLPLVVSRYTLLDLVLSLAIFLHRLDTY
jgi:hypothetical protein